jgi:pimeloyl-ACP methyl ester carboxylesterase
VLLPGGPGGSGVDTLLGEVPLPPALAARFDLVSLDPRGTNRSNPIRCDADLVANPPNVIPDTGGTLAQVRAYSIALGRSCRAHTGPLLDHIDSVSVARDVDALRAALGEDTISLFTESYGTLAGQMYAETFPTRVRALVLDSVFDHNLSTRRFMETEARAGEDSFTEFAAWCTHDTRCALHGRDASQVFNDVYTETTDRMDLVTTTINHLAGPHWTDLADYLATLADQEPPARTRPASRSEAVPFPIAALCADHRADIPSEHEWRTLWRLQNRAAPHLRTHYSWQFMPLCAAWPAATANPQHRPDIHDTPPILIVNGRHDPASAHEWAIRLADQIDGSTLLTYDGWGHGATNRNNCTTTTVTRYLTNLTMPKPDTHCPTTPPVR